MTIDAKSPKNSLMRRVTHSQSFWDFLSLGIGVAFGAVIINVVHIVLATEVLKAMIQAETTLLGFFGIIVVYAVTSYDRRLDQFEDKLFKLSTGQIAVPEGVLKLMIAQIKTALSSVETNKKDLTRLSALVGMLLMSSIVLSVLTLGVAENVLSEVLCYFGLNCFFVGLGAVILTLYRMGEPQERIK